MTFTEMQNQVKVLLGDTSDTFYTTTEVQDQLNRTFPEIATEAEVLLTYCDYDLSSGVQRYSLKQEVLTIKRVEYQVDASRHETLKFLNLDEFHWIGYAQADQESEPEWYKIEYGATETDNDPQRPGDIWLYPTPDTTTAAGYPNLRVWYFQQPSTLSTGTDISELPVPLHMVTCYKAASTLALKNKDLRTHQALVTMATDGMFRYKQNANRDQRDRPHMTQEVMGYTDYISEEIHE